MTRKLKNILISMFGMLALLLTGIFFVGCGPDYSKISLVANLESLDMSVGETKDVLFKIEGFQKGFSNKVTLIKEGEKVFDATAQAVSDDTIKVSVKALSGGNGILTVKTWEANKLCSVNINVEEVSSYISPSQDLFYVSESKEFVPNVNMFDFSANSTNRDLKFYFLEEEESEEEFDLNDFTFAGFENEKAMFRNELHSLEFGYVQIDKVRLDEENSKLVTSFNGQEKTYDAHGKFRFLTVYQPSILEDGSANIFSVNDVLILKDLKVAISGGFLQSDGSVMQADGTDGFAPILDGSVLAIVPNRANFVQYILKIETDHDETIPVDFNVMKSNDNIVVDFAEIEEDPAPEKDVKYIKISQNSLRQATTDISLEVFYEIAKGVEDQSVNFMCDFTVETQIAPSEILVNGQVDEELEKTPFMLYNYNYGEYGWKEFYVDVISNFQSTPTYEGIIFTQVDESLELITSNGTPIVLEKVYSDLSKPFLVKGKAVEPKEDAIIRIEVVKKGILKNSADNIPFFDIHCMVHTGARTISVEEQYSNDAYFYVDAQMGEQTFNAQLFANEMFQSFTTQFSSGVDVVRIVPNENPCRTEGNKHYLAMTLLPKGVGQGKYEIFLDNGVSLTVTFDCRNFLKESTTHISLSPTGNSAVTSSSLTSSKDDGFMDTLFVEILNPSTKDQIRFGSTANFDIVADIDTTELKPIQDTYSYVTVSNVGKHFTITTREGNGETKLTFILTGNKLAEGDFLLESEPTTIELVVNVSTYSLASEFFLSNAGSYAYSRNVYFGSKTIPEDETKVAFSPVLNHENSKNFFQYVLDPSKLPFIFDDQNLSGLGDEIEGDDGNGKYLKYQFDVSKDNFEEIFPEKMVFEDFKGHEHQFISFSMLNSNQEKLDTTYLEATLTKTENGNVEKKTIRLNFLDGIMFWFDKTYSYDFVDENLNTIRYELSFDNLIYNIPSYGTFDFETFNFTNTSTNERTITFSAQIKQRNKSQRFDAKVAVTQYTPVESISLSSGTSKIDFSSQKLTETIGVYTYPINSTNNDIRVQFVPTGNNIYPSMVNWTVDNSNAANGIFLITLSCQEFYANNSMHGGISIEQIETDLTGDMYIFPSDWGTSYTSLTEGSNAPIKLSLQYHNGSRANPYVLEDREDVENINLNEATLRSHYEIRSAISMASTNLKTPIGILDGELVGFSGSIVGTNSQAGFVDVALSKNNLSEEVGGTLYAGLFAQLNSGASLENFSVEGQVNLDELSCANAHIGLVCAQNFGDIVNVGATLKASNIAGEAEKLYFGGLTGLNYGTISQNFRLYDGTGYLYHKYVSNAQEEGKTEFVSGFGNVKTFTATFMEDEELGKCALVGEEKTKIRVNEDGFAIDENGDFIKFNDDGTKMSPNRDFSGQSSKNLAFFNADTTISVEGKVYAGGVAGANSGRIERILPTSSDFKTYGYTAYSSYARINVVGKATKVVLGGVAGLVTYFAEGQEDRMPQGKDEETGNALVNLLVGGKLSTITLAETVDDNVGGLVGYASTAGVANVEILKNVVRTFVKGVKNVGGLVGYDDATLEFSEGSRYVTYGENADGNDQRNIFEAVDDGENGISAASIVRATSEKENPFKEHDLTFMIGNSHSNNREYVENQNSLEDEALKVAFSNLFEMVTYVSRSVTKIKEDEDENVTINHGSKNTYYGDFLVVERNTDSQSVLTGAYDILQAVQFTKKSVTLELKDSKFAMHHDYGEDANLPDVLFMHYFHVDTDLAGNLGSSAQSEIESLNYVTPSMTEFYPLDFVSTNPEVSISSVSGNALDIDTNGNITLKGPGIAEIHLSSILNSSIDKIVYIYVVNFFNNNISSSIFFVPSQNLGYDNIQNSEVDIFGEEFLDVYMQPNYALSNTKNSNGDSFSVSPEGILTFNNVSYVLSQNADLSIESDFVEDGERFSSSNVVGQKVVFKKNKSGKGVQDEYELVPILRTTITIDGKEYVFYKKLENAKARLILNYNETATAIGLFAEKLSMKTNEELNERILVETTNPVINHVGTEKIFYRIEKIGGDYVQSKEPNSISFDNDEEYLTYLNDFNSLENNLFALTFEREQDTNNFTFNLQINKDSDHFANRFETPITGQYKVKFFSGDNRANNYFVLTLDEAQLNYVSVNNFSNFQNPTSSNLIVEPGTKGLLEISLNPMEAIFDTFTISNNQMNFASGAGAAQFMFAYRTATGLKELEGFGDFQQGQMLTFTYQQLLDKLKELKTTNGTVSEYVGKIYITYFVPSLNVQDNVPMAFDISVTPFESDDLPQNTTLELKTKLGSYAKFVFDDKQMIGDGYYVAKGLSYDLSLQTFGFEEDQVDIRLGDQGDFTPISSLAEGHEFGSVSISGQQGKYVLKVSSQDIAYNGKDMLDLQIQIRGRKVLNGVSVESINILNLHILDFVFNYQYVNGKNEDIVQGMTNGIVNLAVGNAFVPQLTLEDYIEFDSNNPSVVSAVNTFMNEMTSHVTWTVVNGGVSTILTSQTSEIRDDYYHIKGMNITPVRVYGAEEDIYHFVVEGFYRISNGKYVAVSSSQGANMLYTRFDFDVHEQSTQNSPIPINNYDELIEKLGKNDENGWYILLDNIDIPNAVTSLENGTENFAPLNFVFAGLDGNNKAFNFSGIYNFEDVTNVGLFGTIQENSLLQNITIRLKDNVTFHMNNQIFNVGLLAGENQGIITNAQTEAINGATFTVNSQVAATEALVAGLVAQNSGYITNSQTTVDISAPYDLAGFVGENDGGGRIASSYFSGASLQNTSSTTQERTAGFVLENSGEIFTSYVSGDLANDGSDNQNERYYSGQNNKIDSGNDVAGFVFSNNGTIEDCYSNILLAQDGTGAGFVFENSSSISRCFSTSVLTSRSVESFGFAQQNSIVDENQERQGGTIEECYFLQHTSTEVGDLDINHSIKNLDDDENADIVPLDFNDFKIDFDTNGGRVLSAEKTPFKNFAITKGRNTNSVWFFNDNENDTSNDAFNFKHFNVGRIELVAPNIKAISDRRLDTIQTVVDPETGAETPRYTYIYNVGQPTLGSERNPILISNAEEFETYMKRECDNASNNTSHYRLVSDIDFGDFTENSTLYDVNFKGYLEGNFMSIEGINLLSSRQRTYAGLFGQIGKARGVGGVVMNLSYTPTTVSFSNTEVVGAFAGKLDGGTLVNINLTSDNGAQLTIGGKNIVGGLVGMAVGDFKMEHIHSDFGATARSQVGDNTFDASSTSFAGNSFAGSIAGVLSGTGHLSNVEANTDLTVMGGRVGLLFGFVDERVEVSEITLEMSSKNRLNGFEYSGLVVGESKGTFKGVKVVGNGEFSGFDTKTFIPNSVGGFAGLISGGVLENISVKQDINMSTISSSTGVGYIGGVAGKILGGVEMKDIVVNSNIVGFNFVGGVAGQISTNGAQAKFEDINVTSDLSVLGRMVELVGMGGLAGEVAEESIISITSKQGSNTTQKKSAAVDDLSELQQNIATIDRLLALPGLISKASTDKETDKEETLKEELKTKISEVNEICTKYGEAAPVITAKNDNDITYDKAKLSSVCTKIQAKISEIFENMKKTSNNFDIGAHVNIYVYGGQSIGSTSGVNVHVGAIIGKNSSGSVTVYGTFANLHGVSSAASADIVVNDLSVVDDGWTTSTLKVEAAETTGTATLSTQKGGDKTNIIVSQPYASSAYSFCDLTAKTKKTSAVTVNVFVSIYGNLYIPTDNS